MERALKRMTEKSRTNYGQKYNKIIWNSAAVCILWGRILVRYLREANFKSHLMSLTSIVPQKLRYIVIIFKNFTSKMNLFETLAARIILRWSLFPVDFYWTVSCMSPESRMKGRYWLHLPMKSLLIIVFLSLSLDLNCI